MVRNALAAVLASAAAALVYSKPGKAKKRGDDGQGSREARSFNPKPEKHSPAQRVAKKARKKAAAATETVSGAAKIARTTVSAAVKSEVAQAATRGVAKAAKSAAIKAAKRAKPAAAGRSTRVQTAPAAPAIDVTSSLGTPKRKTRSDSGTKRTPRKTRAAVGAPGALQTSDFGETETSSLALAAPNANSTAPEVVPGSVDEQVSEAHPS
jgi:hypothetical protein